VKIVFAGSRLSIEIVPEGSNKKGSPIAKVEEHR